MDLLVSRVDACGTDGLTDGANAEQTQTCHIMTCPSPTAMCSGVERK